MPPKPSVPLREPSITQSELLPPVLKPKQKGPTSEQVEAIYQAYPKKVGKDAALKAIRKALLTGGVSYDELLRKVQIYAGCRAGQDTQYTPYPQKWFNEKRWLDEQSSWREASKPITNGKPYVKSLQEKESERLARIAESGSDFFG